MGPVYLDGAVGDGFVLCVACANKRDPEWQRVGSGLVPLFSTSGWDDGSGLYCDDCTQPIYEAEPEPEEVEDDQADDSDDETSVFWKPGEETLALARWVNGGPLPGEPRQS